MALKKRKTTPVSTQQAIAELFNKLEEANCDPIAELAAYAMSTTTPIEMRVSILKDLAQYTAPKRRSVDVVQQSNEGVKVTIVKYAKNIDKLAERMMRPEELQKARAMSALEAEEEELRMKEQQKKDRDITPVGQYSTDMDTAVNE